MKHFSQGNGRRSATALVIACLAFAGVLVGGSATAVGDTPVPDPPSLPTKPQKEQPTRTDAKAKKKAKKLKCKSGYVKKVKKGKAKCIRKVKSKSKKSANVAAKKKSKKCKKGYTKKTTKKRGKKTTKCVKKKANPKTSETVDSVTLGEVDTRSMMRKLPVTIKLKKAVASVKVTVYAKRGPRTISDDVTVEFATGELEKSVTVGLNEYRLLIDRQLKRFETTRWVEVDGVKSNVR